MSVIYTTGSWKAKPGSENAFVAAWSEFASWASSMPGAGTLRLARDLTDADRFTSFGDWQSMEQVRGSNEFRERIGQVLQHVDEFSPAELALVATAEAGDAETHAVAVTAGEPTG